MNGITTIDNMGNFTRINIKKINYYSNIYVLLTLNQTPKKQQTPTTIITQIENIYGTTPHNSTMIYAVPRVLRFHGSVQQEEARWWRGEKERKLSRARDIGYNASRGKDNYDKQKHCFQFLGDFTQIIMFSPSKILNK